MINEPSVDALVRKLGTEEDPVSRYELCVVVAKRTRHIIAQMQATGVPELPGTPTAIVPVCQEIMNGKVHISRD